MGLLSHLFTMGLGFYGGLFVAQNYEIEKVPSASELTKKLEQFMSQYKKQDK